MMRKTLAHVHQGICTRKVIAVLLKVLEQCHIHIRMTIKTNKQKHQKTTRAGEHVEKLELLSFAGGNINGAASGENNMAVPQKLKIE